MTIAQTPYDTVPPIDAPAQPDDAARRQHAVAWLLVVIAVAAIGYPLARYIGLGPRSGPWAYWPALGALCGILFRRPYREWPAIAIAAVLAQTVTIFLVRGDLAGGATLVGAIAGVAQAAVAAWLLRRRTAGGSTLERPADLAWFVLVAVTLVPLAITPIPAYAYAAAFHLTFYASWRPLFVGNSLSVLLFAPLFMCWGRAGSERTWRASNAEVVLCQLTVTALAVLTFANPESWVNFIALPYSMFLALAWSALRCGTSWTTIAIVILATISAWCSSRGLGPFGAAAGQRPDAVLSLEAYLAFASFSALLLSAFTEHRRRAFVALALHTAVQDAFFESSSAPMVMKDLYGRYVIVNRAAAEAFGRPASELIGRNVAELTDARSTQTSAIHDRRVLERGEALHFDETISDGTRTRRLLVTRFPVPDETGVTRFIGVIARDESAERELADRLRRVQGVELLGQLSAGVAHDLNNLLTILVSNSALLGERTDLSDEEREMLDEMRDASAHAARLTSRLLAIGRGASEGPRPVDVDQALQELAPLLRAFVRGNVELELSLGAPDARIVANPMIVEQVVLNLIANARAAIPEDGRVLVATSIVGDAREAAGEAPAGRILRLTVADTGRGMDGETLDRIFEPFFTTRAESGGTGLGLYTAAMLIKQAGGMISATSAMGVGTTFVVDLPMQQSDGAERE